MRLTNAVAQYSANNPMLSISTDINEHKTIR